MTSVDEGFVGALETEAKAQLQVIRDYRASDDASGDRARRAKLAIGLIGAYVRLRATMANERSNDLIERRLTADEGRAPLTQRGALTPGS